QGGCIAVLPGSSQGSFRDAYDPMIRSLGRFPDGHDSDSNCEDFKSQNSITLTSASTISSKNIKVANEKGFSVGQQIVIGTGSNAEKVTITEVGTKALTFGTGLSKAHIENEQVSSSLPTPGEP